MLTISVAAARAQAAILSKSTDHNVRAYASALEGEAEAAAAAGESSFDLSQPATQVYQDATAALAAAIQQSEG